MGCFCVGTDDVSLLQSCARNPKMATSSLCRGTNRRWQESRADVPPASWYLQRPCSKMPAVEVPLASRSHGEGFPCYPHGLLVSLIRLGITAVAAQSYRCSYHHRHTCPAVPHLLPVLPPYKLVSPSLLFDFTHVCSQATIINYHAAAEVFYWAPYMRFQLSPVLTVHSHVALKKPVVEEIKVTPDVVADSPHKISIAGISGVLSSEMLVEIVCSSGQLAAYRFVCNEDLGGRCAFLEYIDHSITNKACAGLNRMNIGGCILTAIQVFPNPLEVICFRKFEMEDDEALVLYINSIFCSFFDVCMIW